MSSSNEFEVETKDATTAKKEIPRIPEDIKYWETAVWEAGMTGFHMTTVNANLTKHLEWLTNTEKTKPLKIFVPLCGKSLDLMYLVGKGHQVFGVEAVYKCIQDLQQEQNVQLIFDSGKSIYYTEDRKLTIYLGDILKCPIEDFGPFDAIWDRASFVAIEYHLRQAYVEVMKRSVKNGDHEFRYLLEGMEYDRAYVDVHPRSIDALDMENYFASWTTTVSVSKAKSWMPKIRRPLPKDKPLHSVVYQLSKKYFISTLYEN